MKPTRLIALLMPTLLPATLLADIIPDTTLDLSFFDLQPDDLSTFDWGSTGIWDNGVPLTSSSVSMPTQYIEIYDPETEETSTVYANVSIYLTEPTTVASLDLGYAVALYSNRQDFTVTGTTTAEGIINAHVGTMSLGTYTAYNAATNTLNSGSQAHFVTSYDSNLPVILQFKNADIHVSNAGWNLWGVNTFVRDQITGLNAFRNLRESNAFFSLADGYNLAISGNFTIGPNSFVETRNFGRTPQFNVGGNLINNGIVRLGGNSVFNVAGTYSGTGKITSSGGNNQISVFGAYVQQGDVTVDGGDTLDFGNDFTLNGNLSLTGNNTVVKVAGNLTNNDKIIISKGNGTKIEVTGDILQTGGKVDTGPSGVDSFTMKARTGTYQNNACISGEGKLIMELYVNNSYITPGNTPGTLSIEGNLTITGTSDLEIELGGTVTGDSYDVLAQSGGTTTLGGTLTLQVIDHFECLLTSTDTFTVLTSDQPLAGSFTNVTSGARLATADGLGTFLVTYGSSSSSPNAVVLSDFIAAPVAAKTFDEWSVEQDFPSPDPGGDQNHNGVLDMLEYTFGSSSGVPCIYTTTVDEGAFVWTYGIPKYVTGVTITSISFNDLPASVINGGPAPEPAGSTASMNLHTITDSAASPRKFYQLRVELAD